MSEIRALTEAVESLRDELVVASLRGLVGRRVRLGHGRETEGVVVHAEFTNDGLALAIVAPDDRLLPVVVTRDSRVELVPLGADT